MRICELCKNDFPLEMFSQIGKRGGYRHSCKACHTRLMKRRYVRKKYEAMGLIFPPKVDCSSFNNVDFTMFLSSEAV